ncbi:hypothetical protein J2X61_006091 [Bacillus sp. 3255]|nr:hypothetical protein [Bacillus sp. 3255]
MKSKLIVVSAMVLNVIFMLFVLYGQSYVEYAPTIGWLGAFITSLVIFVSYLIQNK